MKKLFLLLLMLQAFGCATTPQSNRHVSSTDEDKESELKEKRKPQLGPYTRALHEGMR
jgi:hypothetical protein